MNRLISTYVTPSGDMSEYMIEKIVQYDEILKIISEIF